MRQSGRSVETVGATLKDIVRNGVDFTARLADGREFTSPILVNAAGAWAGTIAKRFGEPVPLEAVAPMLMITERRAPFLTPVVGATSRTLSFKQFANGTVLIGGGYLGRADPRTNRTILDYTKLGENARTVQDLFPIRSRTCFRSCATPGSCAVGRASRRAWLTVFQ